MSHEDKPLMTKQMHLFRSFISSIGKFVINLGADVEEEEEFFDVSSSFNGESDALVIGK